MTSRQRWRSGAVIKIHYCKATDLMKTKRKLAEVCRPHGWYEQQYIMKFKKVSCFGIIQIIVHSHTKTTPHHFSALPHGFVRRQLRTWQGCEILISWKSSFAPFGIARVATDLKGDTRTRGTHQPAIAVIKATDTLVYFEQHCNHLARSLPSRKQNLNSE